MSDYNEVLTVVKESVFKTAEDILWNKEAFESGKINLLFIVGYSGSGKSTLSRGVKATVIEMDRVVLAYDKPREYFESLPKPAYEFCKGPGRKYYRAFSGEYRDEEKSDIAFHYDKSHSRTGLTFSYDSQVSKDFITWIIAYSSTHKKEKFVAEGVWCFLYCTPQLLEPYAVYIRGTSMLKSAYRASKRGSNQATGKESKLQRIKYAIGRFVDNGGTAITRRLEKFQKYFGDKIKAAEEKSKKEKDKKK